jgi:hypothetical protein
MDKLVVAQDLRPLHRRCHFAQQSEPRKADPRSKLRLAIAALAALLLAPGIAAAGPIPCTDIPLAQRFLDKLQPGPNTRAAQRHLNRAKQARSEAKCSAELRKVDYYARRAAAADKQAKH